MAGFFGQGEGTMDEENLSDEQRAFRKLIGPEAWDHDWTGFTSRLVRAVAWLREAWISADPGNAVAIENALAMLFLYSHSAGRNERVLFSVLKHDHDRGEILLENVHARMHALQEKLDLYPMHSQKSIEITTTIEQHAPYGPCLCGETHGELPDEK